MSSVVVERNVPTDIPAIWLLRTFWSEESIRKLDCYCHWLGGNGHWQYIFGRRSICSKCGETGKVDVSQNYVDRVMSEAMSGLDLQLETRRLGTKNTGNENKTRPRIGGRQKCLMCTKVQSNWWGCYKYKRRGIVQKGTDTELISLESWIIDSW